MFISKIKGCYTTEDSLVIVGEFTTKDREELEKMGYHLALHYEGEEYWIKKK